jgi:O-antigen ligase
VFGLSVASAAAVLVSIAAAQILMTLTVLAWVITRPRRVRWPGWTLPVLALMAATLLSLAVSPEPDLGIRSVGKFVLFAMGLLGANFIVDEKRLRVAITLFLAVAALSSAVAVVQFVYQYREFLTTGSLADDPTVLARSTGFMSHWMTFSGEQMLVWCMSLPLVWRLRSRLSWSLLSLVAVGILISMTRSLWIGAGAGVVLMALYLPARVLLRLLIPAGVVALAGSGLIVARISQSFQSEDFAPDSARLAMIDVGVRMILDHPLFGVGPERVREEFPDYFRGEGLDRFYYYHLHNDFLQIAAERGLPALAALLWLIGRLAYDLVGFSRSAEPWVRWPAVSGLAVLVSFFVAGQFEFNLGDSEMLMFFMFLVSIPYGMAWGRAGR